MVHIYTIIASHTRENDFKGIARAEDPSPPAVRKDKSLPQTFVASRKIDLLLSRYCGFVFSRFRTKWARYTRPAVARLHIAGEGGGVDNALCQNGR
jgi:hypothetical protein